MRFVLSMGAGFGVTYLITSNLLFSIISLILYGLIYSSTSIFSCNKILEERRVFIE